MGILKIYAEDFAIVIIEDSEITINQYFMQLILERAVVQKMLRDVSYMKPNFL